SGPGGLLGRASSGGSLGGLLGGRLSEPFGPDGPQGTAPVGGGASSSGGPPQGRDRAPAEDDMEQDDLGGPGAGPDQQGAAAGRPGAGGEEGKVPSFSSILEKLKNLKHKDTKAETEKTGGGADDDMDMQLPPRPAALMESSGLMANLRDLAMQAEKATQELQGQEAQPPQQQQHAPASASGPAPAPGPPPPAPGLP
ncbi:unnamed protein product, partial [Prorocentrum cordatum]